jgi:hypothetical protein
MQSGLSSAELNSNSLRRDLEDLEKEIDLLKEEILSLA